MQAHKIKEWFNQTFFEDKEGTLVAKDKVAISQKLVSPAGEIELPAMFLSKDNTYAQVFHEIHQYLKANGDLVVEKEKVEDPTVNVPKQEIVENPELGKLIDLEVVTYRKKDYRVEKYAKGKKSNYRVIRLDDYKIIDPDKKTYGHAIAAYQEQLS